MTDVPIVTEWIKLDAFLKFSGACESGGEAKNMVQAGVVLVNKLPCTQRGRKLYVGDHVALQGEEYEVSQG